MPTIKSVQALEILDSRGRPTIYASCTLTSGITGAGSVPSGASTGRAEARELRDGDPTRYRGLGCRQAVKNVNETIQSALTGKSFVHQTELDTFLIELDGTPTKERLGANAILAVSLAVARAFATEQQLPLYQYFGAWYGEAPATMPRLTVNLFSGGKHAGGQVSIQDVLLVPLSVDTVEESLAILYDVYHAAADLMAEKYNMRLLTADEGGLAPLFPNDEAMLQDAVSAIERAGYQAGQEVGLAIDVASSHFFQAGVYHLNSKNLTGTAMIDQVKRWVQNYPLVSVEDGLSEEDWTHWALLASELPASVLVVGDDLLCTNPTRIQKAINERAANALLLKVNQIGTFTEALQACQLARQAGWSVVVSARSGETEDNWLADLAVGWHGDFIKVGSITQSERLAKYNRLLMIEKESHFRMSAVSAKK